MFLFSGYAWAASYPVSCPDTIDVKQQLSSPIEGWKAGLDSLPHRLALITFFDGPPEDNASLAPVSSRVAGKQIATWLFGSRSSRAIWLTCGYAGTAVTLSKSLPASVTSCAVTYNPRQQVSGLPLIEKITCK